MTGRAKRNPKWFEKEWGSTHPHVGFVTHAREFLNVVDLIKIRHETMLNKEFFENKYFSPGYYLMCHAIELGLKSYLVQHGYTLEELRKKPFGHNLCSILAETEKCGIDSSFVAPSLHSAIVYLNDLYMGKMFEYRGKPGIIRLGEWPCVKIMRDDIQRLLHLLNDCYRADSIAEKEV